MTFSVCESVHGVYTIYPECLCRILATEGGADVVRMFFFVGVCVCLYTVCGLYHNKLLIENSDIAVNTQCSRGLPLDFKSVKYHHFSSYSTQKILDIYGCIMF